MVFSIEMISDGGARAIRFIGFTETFFKTDILTRPEKNGGNRNHYGGIEKVARAEKDNRENLKNINRFILRPVRGFSRRQPFGRSPPCTTTRLSLSIRSE